MTTPNLDLPELIAGQSQPHIPINAALRRLDSVVQLTAASILNTPPGSPAEGDRYLVDATPTGAWVGYDGYFATFIGGDWELIQPGTGWLAYVVDEGATHAYLSGAWSQLSLPATLPTPADKYEFMDDFDHYCKNPTSTDNWLVTLGGSGAALSLNEATGYLDHPGILEFFTGTTTTGSADLCKNIAVGTVRRGYLLDSTALVVSGLIYIPTLPDGTQTFAFQFGLRDSNAFANRIGALLRWDGSNVRWAIITNVGGGGSVTTAAATGATAATWHHLRMEITSAEVNLYVDRSLVATYTAAMPSVGMVPFAILAKSAGSTSRQANLDFIRITKEFSTPRYVE